MEEIKQRVNIVQVEIKNMIFTVHQVDPDDKDLQTNEEDKIILGRTMTLEQKILVRKDLPPTRKLSVIVHELTHAFIDVYGFSEMGKWSEEQLCSFNEAYASDIVSLANNIFKQLS